jgi:heme-degrading monooxygenase HmoA
MILREWRGRAEARRADEYPAHFRARVMPELREVPGFLGAYLMSRRIGDLVEFTVISKWQSMDAVRAFAGADPSKAVVEPGAVAALRDFDERVTHHELVEAVPAD